jgi:hypothetical protein
MPVATAWLDVALMQGIMAAFFGLLLRQAWWWMIIHVLFFPLIVWFLLLQWGAWTYLLVSSVFILVFWRTITGNVPVFFSSQAVVQAVAELVEEKDIMHFAELGAGIGTVAKPLADNYPLLKVHAFENAPLLWLVNVWRSRKMFNLHAFRHCFWQVNLANYDLVFAYLSPSVMSKLGAKVRTEMRVGSLFVSSSFPVQNWEADTVIYLDDWQKTCLFCYVIKENHALEVHY